MLTSTPRVISAVLTALFCTLLIYQFALSQNTLFKSASSSALDETPLLAGLPPQKTPSHPLEGNPRVRQATTILPGKEHPTYERALKTHIRHGDQWGRPTDVLRQFLVEDIYYNKPAYLLYLIYHELAKPVGLRAEWIFWFDADTIVLNPFIPLEVFLPPSDFRDVNFLGAKDWNGFNAGVLFIKVNKWSVDFLLETMAEPLLRPEIKEEFAEQGAMSRVFLKEKYRDNVLFQPRDWYNAYSKGDDDLTEPEVRLGHMQVHFPGLAQKEGFMNVWLDRVERTKDWETPLHNTSYTQETTDYWAQLRSAKELLGLVGTAMKEVAADTARTAALQDAQTELQQWMREDAHDKEKMDLSVTKLKNALNAPKQEPPLKQKPKNNEPKSQPPRRRSWR